MRSVFFENNAHALSLGLSMREPCPNGPSAVTLGPVLHSFTPQSFLSRCETVELCTTIELARWARETVIL